MMREEGTRALPREEGLGRGLDGRGFWEAIGRWPGEGRLGWMNERWGWTSSGDLVSEALW